MSYYKKCYFLFIVGGLGYALLEIIARGHTHPSMAIAGGLSLISIDYINISFYNSSIFYRGTLSALAITGIELIIGIWVNLLLDLKVWNYSEEPLNFLGQICLPYTFLWFLISTAVIIIMEKFLPSYTKA